MSVETMGYLALYSVECASADEENILGVHRYHFLLGMLASTLGRHIYH